MPLRSATAPFQSLALILARTAVRSGASLDWMVSMASAGVAAIPPSSRNASKVERRWVMVCPFTASFEVEGALSIGTHPSRSIAIVVAPTAGLRGHRREHVARAVLDELAGAGEREMRAADHHFVGDHPVEQRLTGGHGKRPVLVVGALPFRMGRGQR